MAEKYFLNREPIRKDGRNYLRPTCGLVHNIWYVVFKVLKIYSEGTKLFPKKLPIGARQ